MPYTHEDIRSLLDGISSGGVVPEWELRTGGIGNETRVFPGPQGIDAVCTMQCSNNSKRREQQAFIAAAPQIVNQLLNEIEFFKALIEAMADHLEDGFEDAMNELDER